MNCPRCKSPIKEDGLCLNGHNLNRREPTENERRKTSPKFTKIEHRTLDRIGQEMGLTRERVRQVQDIALVKVKKRFSSLGVHGWADVLDNPFEIVRPNPNRTPR